MAYNYAETRAKKDAILAKHGYGSQAKKQQNNVPATTQPKAPTNKQVGSSMSADTYKKYEKSYNQYKKTGKYGDTSWMKQDEVDLFNNIRTGKGKSALSNGKYYYMDNDTYDKYGRSRANWKTTGQYGDTSWMNQNDVDAFNAIRGSRSAQDNAFDDFRYSLDDNVLKAVQDKFRSQWGDKYYYDITDADDLARMNAGQMPKYLAKRYKANDPYDQWLYENNLPSTSDFNDMYSQAVLDYNEQQQKRSGQLQNIINSLGQFDQQRAAFLQGRAQGKTPEEMLATGDYDAFNAYYKEPGKEETNPYKARQNAAGSTDYSAFDKVYDALYSDDPKKLNEALTDDFWNNYSDKEWQKYLNQKLAWNEGDNDRQLQIAADQSKRAWNKAKSDYDKQVEKARADYIASLPEEEQAAYQQAAVAEQAVPAYQAVSDRIVELRKEIRRQQHYVKDLGRDPAALNAAQDEYNRLIARKDELETSIKNEDQQHIDEIDTRLGQIRKEISRRQNAVLGLGLESTDEIDRLRAEADALKEERAQYVQKQRDQSHAEKNELYASMDIEAYKEKRLELKAQKEEELAALKEQMKNRTSGLTHHEAMAKVKQLEFDIRTLDSETLDESASKATQLINSYIDRDLNTDPVDVSSWKNKTLANQYLALTGQENNLPQDVLNALQRRASFLSDAELEALNGAASLGEEEAKKYIKALQDIGGVREQLDLSERVEDWARDNPGLASAGSVPASALSSVEGLASQFTGNAAQIVGNSFMTTVSKSVRNAVSSQIIAENSTESSVFRGKSNGEIYSFVYQTGMSIADSLFRNALLGLAGSAGATQADLESLGNIGLMIAGGSAASNTVLDNLLEGRTTRQALSLAAVGGIAEILTEKVSLDSLIDTALAGRSAESVAELFMRTIPKQMIAEGSEEFFSEAINILAEAIILGEPEGLREKKAELMRRGYTENQAAALALLSRAGEAFMGGALSGGAFGLGGFVGQVNSDFDANREANTLKRSIGSQLRAQMTKDAFTLGLADDTSENSIINVNDYLEENATWLLTADAGQAIIQYWAEELHHKALDIQEANIKATKDQQKALNNLTELYDNMVAFQKEAKVALANRDTTAHATLIKKTSDAMEAYINASAEDETQKKIDSIHQQKAAEELNKWANNLVDETLNKVEALRANVSEMLPSGQADALAALGDQLAKAEAVDSIETDDINSAKAQAMENGDTEAYNLLDELVNVQRSGNEEAKARFADEHADLMDMLVGANNAAQQSVGVNNNIQEEMVNANSNGRNGQPAEGAGSEGPEINLLNNQRGRNIGDQAERADTAELREGEENNESGNVGNTETSPAKSWLGVDHTRLFKHIAASFNSDMGLKGANRIKASDFQILTEPTNARSADLLARSIARNGGESVFLYRSTHPGAPGGFAYNGNIYINDTGDGRVAFVYGHEFAHGNNNKNAIQNAGREVWNAMKDEGSDAFDRYCTIWHENPNNPTVMNEFIADIRGAYEYAIQNNGITLHDQLGLTDAEANRFYEAFAAAEAESNETAEDLSTAIHDVASGKNDTDFNYHSMNEDRAAYRQDLINAGLVGEGKAMSEAELNSLFDTIDSVMDIVGKNRGILDFFGDAGKETRAYKPYKKNADPHYKLALDFSTLCRKRVLLQSIAERLQAQLGRSISPEETVAIRNEIKKYKEAGKKVEVACALCYVEAARLKSPKVINKFLDNRKQYMTDYFAKKNSDFMTSVHEAQANFKVAHGYAPDATKKQMSPADVRELNKLTPKLRSEYQPGAEEAAIIEKAVTMSREQYLSAKTLTKMAKEDPQIYDAFITAVRSATRSKAQESAVPYFRGDVASVGQDLIDEMNEESGFRHQSWSDFEMIHLLDNISAVIELATRGAKVHAYTKVPAMVIVNGNTGMMLNMSEIPAGQTGIAGENIAQMNELINQYAEAVRNGEDTSDIANQITEMLTFDPNEGMPKEEMAKLRDKFHATAGNIMIGINDTQIRALLASELIDYVIPYHTSGLNKEMRRRMGIKAWQDYTASQNEKANGKGTAGTAPRLNEWFNIKDAKNAADGVQYMQEASQRYLDLCFERNLDPKFKQFLNKRDDGSYELADDALNYWKLLTDRKMVDQVTGEIIEQQKILPNFNKGDLETLLNEELADPQHRDDQEVSDAIIDKVVSGELKIGKADKEEAKRLKDLSARYAVEEAANFSNHAVTPVQPEESGTGREAEETKTPKEYTYEYLKQQNPMSVVVVPSIEDLGMSSHINEERIEELGEENAKRIAEKGKFDPDGFPLIKNEYSAKLISIPTKSYSHGINGTYGRMATNASMGVVLPYLVQHAIPINDVNVLHPENADRTYLMAAYCQGSIKGVPTDFVAIITVDEGKVRNVAVERAHAVNGKKIRGLISPRLSSYKQGNLPGLAPTITIDQLLDAVKEKFASALSMDVLKQKYGIEERPAGSYNREDRYAIYSSHNLSEGTNAIEDAVIRNARAAQDLYNSGVSVADYMAHSVYDPNVARQLGGIERRNTPAPTGLTRSQRAQMFQWDRERLDNQLRNMKASERAAVLREREKMQQRQDREKYGNDVVKRSRDLMKWMTSPNVKEGKYVPDFFKDAVNDVLQGIDLGSTERIGGQKVQSWRRSMMNLASTLQQYKAHQEGRVQDGRFEGMELDLPDGFVEDFMDLANSITEDGTNFLQDMDADRLKRLDKSIAVLQSGIRNANRMHANARYQTVSDAAEATIREQEGRRKYRDTGIRAVEAVRNMVNAEMLDLESYAQRLGDSGGSVMRSIANGFLKGTTHIKEAQEFFESARERDGVTKKDVHSWTKNTVTQELESGETVSMTEGQLMNLYALSARPQAMSHLLQGGIELAYNKSSKGNQNRAYQLTYGDLDNLFSHLSDKQKTFVADLQRYLSETASGWGNEVSQTLYGIDMYGEEFYWPIRSAKAGLATQDPEKVRAFNAIQNSSFTNAVIRNASNPIMLDDCVQTFCDHVAQMANYNGMAVPIGDAMKWFNYRSRSEEGATDWNSSVKRSITDIMGKDGTSYFINLIKDINGLSEGGTGTNLPSALVANTKKAAVAAKIRVMIQQPTAVVRAMSMIDPKYFVGFDDRHLKTVVNEMQENAPIAWWKAQGNFDIGTGKSMRDIISGDASAYENFVNATMAGAGAMDDLGWSWIWNAVKREQKARHPGLSGDQLMNAVVDRFTDVINKTQVIDTVVHRSQIMRSKDSAVKQSTAFMSEPIKTFNLLHNVLNDVIENRPGAKKRLAKTVAAVAGSWALNAAVLALHDAIKYRDEDDDLWDMLIQNWKGEFGNNFNLFNSIPYVKDVIALAQGEKIERMDMSALADLIDSAQAVGKYLRTGETTYTGYGLTRKFMTALGNVFGTPLTGLLSDAELVVNAVAPGTILSRKTKNWDKANALIDEGISKKQARGLMKNYDAKTNASKALSILTYDGNRDGKPDFDKQQQDLIAEILGISYSPEKDGTLEAYARKSVDSYMKSKEKDLSKGKITEDQYDEYQNIFDTYFELLG